MLVWIINCIAALIWIGVLMKLDSSSKHKENKNQYYVFFAGGMISVVPALILYRIFPWIDYSWEQESWMVFVNYVFITGPVEELSKFLLFIILVLKRKTIREPRDGMLQAASVGLGFSFIENFVYANEYGIYVLVVRCILCISGHMIYASVWGIFTGKIIFEKSEHIKKNHYSYIAVSVISASLIHGLYDYFLSDDTLILGLIMAITINYLAILVAYRIYLKTTAGSPYKLYPLKDFNKAIHIINLALVHDPRNHLLNKRIGLYYLYAEDYESACEHFDNCIKINSENYYCHALAGVAQILSGKKDEGFKLLSESLKMISETTMDALKKNIKAVIDDSRTRDEILAMFEK